MLIHGGMTMPQTTPSLLFYVAVSSLLLMLLPGNRASAAPGRPPSGAATAAPPTLSGGVASVVEGEDARARALRSGDGKALSELMDAEYVHVDSNGRLRTKTEFLSAIASGHVIVKRLQLDSTDIRLLGSCAVVTGQFTIETVLDGQTSFLVARYIRVWTNIGGRWRIAAHQVTPIRRGATWP